MAGGQPRGGDFLCEQPAVSAGEVFEQRAEPQPLVDGTDDGLVVAQLDEEALGAIKSPEFGEKAQARRLSPGFHAHRLTFSKSKW